MCHVPVVAVLTTGRIAHVSSEIFTVGAAVAAWVFISAYLRCYSGEGIRPPP
jgi:hypothetical protein